MPMQSILLKPGVNTERTLSLNEAGVSISQLLRYKDGLLQTYGGWESYNNIISGSTVRDLHAWGGVGGQTYLGVGATRSLSVYRVNSGIFQQVTPQTFTDDVTPNFSVSSGSNVVTVVDSGSGPSVYNSVSFNTPVSVGNILLNGAYQIASVLSSGSYTIISSVAASTTVSSSGILPVFNTTANSASVTVTLPNNTASAITGLQQSFYAPTSVGGLTIQGAYNVISVLDSTAFTINAQALSSATTSATMNSSRAELVYYVTLAAVSVNAAYGAGNYGDGAYESGNSTPITPGTPITTTNWSLDNWGEILLGCPANGAVYAWSASNGFQNSQVVATAPFFNGGLFISMPQQILVLWRSVQSTGTQDNLIVRWSDAGDYTNYVVSNQTTAGSFHIPTGSLIMGGLQAPQYGVIWTDIECWIMSYVGGDVVFNFTKAGTGCGLIGQHAAGVIGGEVYWCGNSNIFKLSGGGVQVVPCTVWDYIFQNINIDNAHKMFCAPNSAFNEIGWFFPSTNSTENDSYVKLNIIEGGWDYGTLSRTAWCDVSILGNPIGASADGTIFEQEEGAMFTGAAPPSFQTGWWSIGDGNELAFVDYVIPDFVWGTFGEDTAEVSVTFLSADYPGDTPKSYGPYIVTRATQYITPRIRGRLMSAQISAANNSFFRIGRVRFRYGASGRR